MMPLSMLKVGEHETIKRISGRDEHRKFLGNLGFVVGEDISIVSASHGNYIINIKDMRIAIDNTMANRIFV